jgi:poly-gamma-glutamate synthesis protein (capsule biosynthesis protein)
MHWGAEYLLVEPGQDQKDLARFLATQDVDLIVGHHPHVVQRFETLLRPNGKEMFCFYSLGNFVSNQDRKDRLLGALMLVTFQKDASGLTIRDPGLLPVVCHFDRNFSNTKVYPLYAYSRDLLEKHWCWSVDKSFTVEYFLSVMNQMGVRVIMEYPF